MIDGVDGNGAAAPGGQAKADVDDRWASALQRFDEALAAGGSDSHVGRLDSSADDAPAEVRKARHCLERLARAQGSWADASPVLMVAGTSFRPNAGKPVDGFSAEPPHCIGRFEIRGELGRGGQGVVFLAWDPKLERELALKVPRLESLLTGDLRRRFLREGRAAAGLNHPHIIAVHEAGEVGPVCYIAQEYCRGGSLAAWLKATTQPVDPRAAANLIRNLADAVEHAHAHGILHRDLKPSNVLLADEGSAGPGGLHPKLTDFGLARALEQLGDETATGAILGTAAYMPPEQAAGRQEEIGRGSDVYGLGAILYELLTGRAPFAGTAPLEILRQVATEDPVRPRAIRREIPRDLEAICLRCLEKRPARRYGTAALLADDLRRFRQGEPTLARPATAVERSIKWACRRPWIATLIGVILASVLALGGTVGVYTVQLRGALALSEQRRVEAEDNRQIVRRQLYASDIRSAQDAWNARRAGDCVDILLRQTPSGADPDLREFCWGHLWQQTHQALQELRGHRGGVHAVEYSPDGRFLVSAGKDGIVRVWYAATGKLLQELSRHASEINALAFAPDGRQLAAVSDKGELVMWSVGDEFRFQQRAALSPSELYALCYAPDGTRIAVGGEDAQVRVVSATDGAVQRELSQHTGPVVALCFWSGGRRLISGGKDSQLLNWDLSSDPPAPPEIWLRDNGPAIRGFDLSTDEQHVAVSRGYVDVLRLSDRERVAKLEQDSDVFSSVRFSNDGKRILCANHDSTWRSWEWQSGRNAFRVNAGHSGRLHSAVFSADEKQVATAGADGLVRQWAADLTGMPYQVTLDFLEHAAAEFSSNGDWLLLKVVRKGDPLRLVSYAWSQGKWQVGTQWSVSERTDAVECAISSDGRWVIRSDGGQNLFAWQQGVSNAWIPIGDHDSAINRLAFASSGNTVLSCSKGKLRAWGLTPARLLWEADIPLQDLGIGLCATTEVLACSAGYAVAVFDLVTGKQLFTRELSGMEILALAITPDGAELLAAGSDRSIYRWSLPGGEPLAPWIGHQASINQLAVHPENRTIATCDKDAYIKLWNRATGQVLISWRQGDANAATFSGDGQYLHVFQHSKDDRTQILSYRSQAPELAPQE